MLGQRRQRLVQLARQLGIVDGHRGQVGEVDGLDAGVGDEVDELGGVGAALVRDGAQLDAQHDAANGARGQLQPHRRAAQTIEQLAHVGVVGDVDPEAGQAARDRLARAVPNRLDPTAVEIQQDHGLEDVVDLVGGEGELDVDIAVHEPVPLEVAHARAVQGDGGDGQLVVRAGRVDGPGCKAERGSQTGQGEDQCSGCEHGLSPGCVVHPYCDKRRADRLHVRGVVTFG